MAEMMFYERVVALSDQIHAQLKVRPASSFSYAARTNSVPVLGGEMFECAREYPIVFARGQVGPLPAVLLGLRENENLFVDAAGKWDARYVPAFVRRYPFVPATGAQGELLVCIDEASPCFSAAEGEGPCLPKASRRRNWNMRLISCESFTRRRQIPSSWGADSMNWACCVRPIRWLK
jgi:hypothetical protein